MWRKFIAAALAVSVVLAQQSQEGNVTKETNSTKRVEQKAAASQNFERVFTVTTLGGKKYHFHVSKQGVRCEECGEKGLILDFFGKHCPPCLASIPTLAKLHKARKDLQIIAFHVQEPLLPNEVLWLKKDLGLNYPIVDMLASGENYRFVEFIGRATKWENVIPYVLFFDPEGRYRAYHYGEVTQEVLRQLLPKITPKKER